MKKKISNKQFASALCEITEGLKGERLRETIKQFVLLLVKYHKLKQGARIIVEFEKYAKKQAGVVEIEITSARKLSETTLNHIKKIFGEHTESVENVDEALLGGMKVKTEDKILDASLKTQLNILKQKL
ncbi:MAG: ATP synthase F1, delta subunit [uncultured bacterium]|uniref:ATP synthase subunit delta n=1 Tax=Candidatus Magasanikbacteria bacterium GW2011_GWA2_42_32 TaxID=1619039 RepID=A0A0G1A907_9BACT|nr:MAG: ATP synthase F1, delta subunit [uncultured bacterium]KKR49178.1 MAG: ATP synthase subunit delta [Candidatus Magasanikbacteria bacterium GW2011_GWC2_40_17]KKS57510.1 MAG: ATP synthase subunit delta [Candidatus Magasanikbacteria bacterium GW2011_GWA2_42_32]OGH85226.1 MAG: ATP synthase F1 subunit delta [Candidatus Magasanikbacteria bacterium RIFOXYB2_FULL_38_10]